MEINLQSIAGKYADDITKYLASAKNQRLEGIALGRHTDSLLLSESYELKNSYELEKIPDPSLNLGYNFPVSAFQSSDIGTHPDFMDIEEEGELHHAVNVFIDIKGSTNLIFKMPLREVRFFKDAMIKSAIKVFQAFGGHIQRLQGDAVFAVFCWKKQRASESNIAALNAVTFLNYFIVNELNPRLISQGYPELAVRTGIDFGHDDQVLWSKYGLMNCTEVTTTSLHTDLASKLQHKAGKNSIMIGDNVRSYLDLPDEFFKIKADDERYIIRKDELNYNMWQFNWENYFKRFLNNPNRKRYGNYIAGEDFLLRCFYLKPGTNEWKEYFSNIGSIPKEYFLEFRLENLSNRCIYDDIIWTVENRGAEAKESEDALAFETTMGRNKLTCPQATAYKGHHYMKCEIYYQGKIQAQEYFGIFVNDN